MGTRIPDPLNNLLIAFELRGEGDRQGTVATAIRALGAATIEVTRSVYYVKAKMSAIAACHRLWTRMDPRDCLFVVDLDNKTAAWQNVDSEAGEFLRQRWHD
jgi:hypothetical protein